MQVDDFAGLRAAGDFGVEYGSESEVCHGWQFGVGLGNHSAELRHCFYHQHTGHQWRAWKVAGQKRFVPTQQIMSGGALASNQLIKGINETKFRTMG